MSRIVAWMSVSLDGYIEGPKREIDWHRVDEELHQHFNDELAKMAAFLCGRVTYELMDAFWPTADADPAASPAVAQFARIWRDMPKVVFSRTLHAAGSNTTVVPAILAEDVRALADLAGGDISVGGADTIAAFLDLALIDEWRLYVHPVLIGAGKPLFPVRDATVDLRLLETRTFGNGVVLLRYERS